MLNILQLIENTGSCYRKKASTGGGEYSGVCPWCGGLDRFSIFPEKDHFVCRQCKKAGDSIEFVKTYHNKTYVEACFYLGISPNTQYRPLSKATEKPGNKVLTWQAREIKHPPEAWQKKAEAVLFEKFKFLLSAPGKKYRDWLNARGINNETIKKARFGYNTQNLLFDRATWGLTPEKKENGQNKQVWIPAGLIIPQFYNEKLVRLRIRQDNPIAKDRFVMVPGSAMGYFDYGTHLNSTKLKTITKNKPSVTTEAELDGWLVQQEAGDLVNVYAIGNASARPDTITHENISDLPGLLNLDNDEAGHNEQDWWSKQYPDILTWYSRLKKDAGEDFQAGVNIREWVQEGLSNLDPVKCSNPPVNTQDSVIKSTESGIEKRSRLTFERQQGSSVAKQKLKSKKTSAPVKPQISNQICMHNIHCNSLSNGICLRNKQPVFDGMELCPQEQWWLWRHKNGVVSEIILGPGVKK
ncbi:MAG: hypothetical protein GY710_26280 [Desulfobacteraceae bacterium]|nr:hypothetical protein [Desulfobacteraceae bacterium]